MSLAPTTTVRGAPPALQPYYFTSSVFVEHLRADINDLLVKFKEAVEINLEAESPFQLFKELWIETGWRWLHLLVIEERGRKSFIQVVERCLLEALKSANGPTIAAGALFAQYTFHTTQPTALYTINHIDVPLDIHEIIRTLPSRLSGPLKAEVSYLIRLLIPQIHLTPSSSVMPTLPYATIARAPPSTIMAQGRPTAKTRRENYQIALRRLNTQVDELDAVVAAHREGRNGEEGEIGPTGMQLPSAEEYVTRKEGLMAALREDEQERLALEEGTAITHRRMKEIEAWAMKEGKDVEGYDWEGKPIGLALVGREENQGM